MVICLATGEPSLCVSVAVPLAIRQALASARKDSDSSADSWVAFGKYLSNLKTLTLFKLSFYKILDGPTTVAATLGYSLPNYTQYKLN